MTQVDPSEQNHSVLIARPECLRCSHLAPEFSDQPYTCITDRNCPARYMKILQGVDMQRYSKRLAECWHSNNADGIAEVMEELAEINPVVSDKVMALAKTKLQSM